MNDTGYSEEELKEIQDIDDEASVVGASVSEPQEPMKEPEIIYEFRKPYTFEGKTYTEIDLSPITGFNTRDMQAIETAFAKTRHAPEKKWFDVLYMKIIAMRATGLPVEFFDGMLMKDFLEIEARIRAYFLFT